jgi:hypothetical protein
MIKKTIMMKPISPSEKEAAIMALDLMVLFQKLTDLEEGPGWSLDKCNEIYGEYKRFLILMVRYPNETIVPNKDVDTFWHAHILDTRKYYDDCIRCYGEFLHHYPYFGLKDEKEAKELTNAFLQTNILYQKEFGVKAERRSGRSRCSSISMSESTCAGRCHR